MFGEYYFLFRFFLYIVYIIYICSVLICFFVGYCVFLMLYCVCIFFVFFSENGLFLGAHN